MRITKLKFGLLVVIGCLVVSFEQLEAQQHQLDSSRIDTNANSAGIQFNLTDSLAQSHQMSLAETASSTNLTNVTTSVPIAPKPTAPTFAHFSDQAKGIVTASFSTPVSAPATNKGVEYQFVDETPTGTSIQFSDERRIENRNPASISSFHTTPRSPSAPTIATQLTLSHLSGARFVDPRKYLKEHSFKFENPNVYLNEVAARKERSSLAPYYFASNRKRNPLQDDGTDQAAISDSGSSSNGKRTSVDEYLQRISVSDIHAPIRLNPFSEIDQIDPTGVLQERLPIAFGDAPASTYSELTGNYFQAHYATWKAHHLYHKPLYFEETNLERYGNQLCYQNVASTVHFFSSAALLPYKIGQTSSKNCITTLGNHRPGECVPYQIHRGPRSPRGAMLQALPIIAISL